MGLDKVNSIVTGFLFQRKFQSLEAPLCHFIYNYCCSLRSSKQHLQASSGYAKEFFNLLKLSGQLQKFSTKSEKERMEIKYLNQTCVSAS